MFGLLDWLKIIGGAALAGVVIGPLAFGVGHWSGETAGYQKHIAEMAAASARAELERKNDDAKLSNMSDYDLCVAGLGGRGLSIEPCEQLRGIHSEQP